MRVSGCHFNTDTAAIELTNFVQFIVNGNLIYATDFDAVSAAYSAITVDGQNASMDSLITDNILQCLLTGVAKNGIVIEPGDIASDDNVTISRNVIVSFDTGIVLPCIYMCNQMSLGFQVLRNSLDKKGFALTPWGIKI